MSAHGGPRPSPPARRPCAGDRPSVGPGRLRRAARGAAAAHALAPASKGRDTSITSGRCMVSKYGRRPEAGKVGTWNRANCDDFLRWVFFGLVVWCARVGVCWAKSRSKTRPGRSPTCRIRYVPPSAAHRWGDAPVSRAADGSGDVSGAQSSLPGVRGGDGEDPEAGTRAELGRVPRGMATAGVGGMRTGYSGLIALLGARAPRRRPRSRALRRDARTRARHVCAQAQGERERPSQGTHSCAQ